MRARIYCFALLGLLAASPAPAYVPPAFYVYSRLAESHENKEIPVLVLSVSRPMSGATEASLGTITLSGISPFDGGWPTLSLLFDHSADQLYSAVERFGLRVQPEAQLLRISKEQAAAMREPPNPFYKIDKTMALQRVFQTYAWVHHGEQEKNRGIWIEKDSFLPVKISGPCPKGEPDWAKPGGGGLCEVEFRDVWGLHRGGIQNARITILKDGQPLLYLGFERVIFPRPGQIPKGLPETKIPDGVLEFASNFLH